MIKKLVFITGISVLLSGLVVAGNTSQRFAALSIDMGARAVGMGSAFTGLANDATAAYWNPAGLANVATMELNFAYNKWILDSSLQYVIGAMPVGYGTLAALFTYADAGTFTRRDDYGIDLNRGAKISQIIGGAAYGAPLTDNISAGLAVKFADMTVDTAGISGVILDAGLFAKAGDIFSFGLALQDIDPGSGSYMPANISLGVGADIINAGPHALLADVDLKYSDIYGASIAAGTEYTVSKLFSLRLGYRYENAVGGGRSGLSAGIGVTVDKLTFDYSVTSAGDLGLTHLVDLKFTAENPEQKEKQNFEKLTGFLAEQDFNDGQDYQNAGDFDNALMKFEQVRDLAPGYAGIDAAIEKAKRMKQGMGGYKKADKLFNEGMEAYENFQYDKAVKSWEEAKKINPDLKDINVWLDDAMELKAGKGMAKQAEKSFKEGLKYYNNCDYDKAVASWQAGLEKDPGNRKIGQYIERTKARQKELQEGLTKAKIDVAKDATVIQGIKNLRNISGICPAYKDAEDILATLKELINTKVRDYYYKGIEKYTDGNLDAAIVYWNNIEALDNKSEYMIKVRRYIEDARNKQKAMRKIGKKQE